jgi:zinc-binding in reverse transcriptase
MEGEVRTIDILSSLSANFCGLDYVVWSLTSSGIYTVRSMYLFFMNTDFSNNTLLSLWDLKLPLKIKCFMLLVLHGKILTRSNLLHRGWGGLVSCPCCNSILKTIDHLFIHCSRMHDLWDSFNLHNNYSFQVPLTSVGNIWDYGCSLSKLQRMLFLSLYSVVFLGTLE